MGFVSSFLGILGFGIGLPLGLLVGFFFFIYSKPNEPEVCLYIYIYIYFSIDGIGGKSAFQKAIFLMNVSSFVKLETL